MPAEVWGLACDLARRARAAGLTIPIADLLITACARYHQVEVLSSDEHFAALAELQRLVTNIARSLEVSGITVVYWGV